ncbi:unnamed protein product [Gordionus sp. m RMFG-2023]
MSNNSLSKHNSIQSKETLGDKINNKNKDINDNKVTKKACDKTPTHQTSIKSFTKPNIPPYTSPPLTFSNHTKKDKNYQKQLVTDYFTVVKRSSLRKCKTDIENEKNNQLEEQIISQFEEGLKVSPHRGTKFGESNICFVQYIFWASNLGKIFVGIIGQPKNV